MTPESLPELDASAFRRALAAALGLPLDGEPPRTAARRAAAWDPLGTIEDDDPPAAAPAHAAAVPAPAAPAPAPAAPAPAAAPDRRAA